MDLKAVARAILSSMSIISADGTTRSKVTTSTDNYATVGNFIMSHNPGIDVKYRKEGGTIITKATNVPTTGTSDRSNTWFAESKRQQQ